MEQILANGLYLGAQYALIALGLTLIFALMNVLNFAHGQMYVLGGFVTYTIYGQLGLPFVVGLAAPTTAALTSAPRLRLCGPYRCRRPWRGRPGSCARPRRGTATA